MIGAEIRQGIISRSLVSVGTRADWQRIFQKSHIRIAYMGGSVTYGYADGRMLPKPYHAVVSDLLEEEGFQVSCTLCADAGMDSLTGDVLAEEYVLNQHPDLVFLEFAINETTLRHSVEYFESLVRRLLTSGDRPTVCLLLMRNANDYSCASFMRPLAEHYGLPCIDIREALNPALNASEIVWNDFGDREGHPNPDGHRLLAECIMNLFRNARKTAAAPPVPLPEPWLDAPFTALQRVEAGSVPKEICIPADYPVSERPLHYFRRSWCITKENGIWTMQCFCRAAVIFFETHNLPQFGSGRILLDGKPVRNAQLEGGVLQTRSIYGWGNARDLVLLNQEKPAVHTVTIEPLEGNVYLLCAAVQ